MYEFTSRVRYSEVGPDLKMKMAALMDRMQDCATFHSQAIGRGPKPIGQVKSAWIIVSWQIICKRMPVFNENITTKTLANRFHGFEGDRDFTIRNDRGDLLAYAASRWIYFDFETQRPMRVPQAEIDGYGVDPAIETEPDVELERAPRHLKVPGDLEPRIRHAIRIRKNHIDSNRHVNNLQYIDMALSVLPTGFEIKEMRAAYSHQAVLGDVLTPLVYDEDRKVTVILKNKEGLTCATVQFYRN